MGKATGKSRSGVTGLAVIGPTWPAYLVLTRVLSWLAPRARADAAKDEQAAAHAAAPVVAGLVEDPAALARPPRRPLLDLSTTTIRPPAHRAIHPRVGAADGSRESHLGLPPDRGERDGHEHRGRLDTVLQAQQDEQADDPDQHEPRPTPAGDRGDHDVPQGQ
jgi:hypothetical protein